MMRMRWILLLLTSALHAQTPNDVFERANQLYREGNIREALAHYASIVEQGYMDAALYYNIGNCHYRLGNVAQAILAYERARRLAPGDPDIEYNLALANARTQDRIESLPELFIVSWMRSVERILPRSAARQWFLVFWGTLFLSLGASVVVVREALLRPIRIAVIVSLVGVLLFGSIFGLESAVAADQDEAIVTRSVVTVKSSPDPQSVDAFVVHEGVKVRVGDQLGEWVRVTLADGKVGWVRVDDLERI